MTRPSAAIPIDSDTPRTGLETLIPAAVRRDKGSAEHDGRLAAVEIFVAILTVLVISLVAYQIHFTLPVVGFVLFLVIVVAAIRLGFWQATVTSMVAVACLDFFFTQPLFSLKTDPAGLTALAAFESAALVVSRLSAQVQLQARIASQQSMNMERLYELARNILLVNRNEPQGPQIARYIQQAIGVESVVLFDSSTLQVSIAGEPAAGLEEFARKAWLQDKGEDDPEGLLWSRVLRVGYKGTGAIAMRADHLTRLLRMRWHLSQRLRWSDRAHWKRKRGRRRRGRASNCARRCSTHWRMRSNAADNHPGGEFGSARWRNAERARGGTGYADRRSGSSAERSHDATAADGASGRRGH